MAAALAVAPVQAASPSPAVEAVKAFEGVWEVRPMRRGGPGDRPQPDPGEAGARLAAKVQGLDRGDFAIYRIMTPAGRAAFEAMNPRDLPANNCRSGGVPTLVAVPTDQAWTLTGDGLSIHHDQFDTTREIRFDGHAPEGPPTALGRAEGAYADGVLTITTARFTAGLGALSRNAPGSAQRVVTERYRLADDGQSMTLEMTVEDPLYLTQPVTLRRMLRRAPAGTTIESFPCDVEASQRDLGTPAS